MTQFYSDPIEMERPYALPDMEVFRIRRAETVAFGVAEPGWYYWACFPDCLPDSDPVGPFRSKIAAIAAAQET